MSQFTPEQNARINAAVAAAESRTVAEIVPVVAESSGRYDRAEDAWGAMLGIFFFLTVDLVLVNWMQPHHQWEEFTIVPLVLQLLGLFAGALLGIVLSNRIASLRRLFITRFELNEEVSARARQLFFDQRIHHTAGRTGVLIYVSLFERKAVILVDETVLHTLGQPFVDTWCADLTNRLKSTPVIDALEQTIVQVGNDLATAMPGSSSDSNELPDALIVSGS